MKLKSLVKSKTIGRAFRQFLERDAEMWLNNSKVEDKDQIKLLITYLLGLLQTNTVESLDTAIKTYKKWNLFRLQQLLFTLHFDNK